MPMDITAFLIALALFYFWSSLTSSRKMESKKEDKYTPWLKIDRIKGK